MSAAARAHPAAPRGRRAGVGPPGTGGAGGRDEPRRGDLRALLEGDDVLLDRAADDLPAGVRPRASARSCRTSAHVKYVEYVATGVVATAVLFSSAFPGMFNTFIRWQFQRTYDAMLAAPVDVEELITAEMLWVSLRAGVYGLAPLLVGFAFGLEPEAGMLLVPLIGFVTGFGFAGFGVTVAAVAKTIDNFNYITSAVLTPMFLVAGTFFPVSTLPDGSAPGRAGQPALPLRAARPRRLARRPRARRPRARGCAVAFALLMWRLAISQLGRRLID